MNRRVWRVNSDNVAAVVVKHPLMKKYHYLYSPRGPLLDDHTTPEDFQLFLRKVEALSGEENVVFYRIEPYLTGTIAVNSFGFDNITDQALLSRQCSPPDTLVLDLEKKEEELLAGMKSKCRYNLNLSRKKGVFVKDAREPDDIKIFYDLNLELEKRGRYHGHHFDYYNNLFMSLSGSNTMKLFIAEHEGQPLAAILVSYFGKVATYLHGASTREKRELMPSYALQWTAIKEAMNRGCSLYDFWGVAPVGEKEHPWSGISRFKRGFGGEELSFGGACDLVLNRKIYKLLSSANRVKKLFR